MSARLIGVTGTDTGVGKTMIAAGLTASLRARGYSVAAVKLVATGVAPGTAGEDAEILARAAGTRARESVLDTFALARSPLAAARAEGRSVDVGALMAAVQRRATGSDVLVLEGVGGILVPLAEDATVASVLRGLDAAVVIVARAGLGTVNHCALTVGACRDAGLRVLGVVLNDSQGEDPDFARENARLVAEQCDVRVLATMPFLHDTGDVDRLRAQIDANLDVEELVRDAERSPAARAEIIRADRSHVWHPFTQTTEWRTEEPIVIRAGEGCWLIDEDGTRYLDGVGSLWANVHGHAHPRLDRAMREQLGRIAHSTFLGQTHAQGALLAQELARVTPAGLTRVFYSEAGAAAIEVALRIALLAQQRRGHRRRLRFLSLQEGYHGDTVGAVSVGRSEPFHRGLDPVLFDVERVPSPYLAGEDATLAYLRTLAWSRGEQFAAFVIEPRIQGAAGMLPHSDAWLRDAVEIAQRAGMLVICDEVATGFGRTGDLFASTGADVVPDIIVLGKGLSAGYLPLSATLVNDELFELFSGAPEQHRTLYYGHTFSGNPLACAVARESLQLFARDGTVERGRELGEWLARGLQEMTRLPGVADIRQRGVMCGIELRDLDGQPFDESLRVGRQVTLAARRKGVIVRPLGDTVVVNPPLVMREPDAALLLDALGEAIVSVMANHPSPVPT